MKNRFESRKTSFYRHLCLLSAHLSFHIIAQADLEHT